MSEKRLSLLSNSHVRLLRCIRPHPSPQETFVIRVTASLTTLLADMASDTARRGAVVPKVEHGKDSR